jgi:phage shock protein E
MALFFSVLFSTPNTYADPINSTMLPEHLMSAINQKSAPWILDVRSSKEYANAHIPFANLISVDELNQKLDRLPDEKNELILLYCQSGHRAHSALQILKNAGYTNLVELEGHFMAWQENGLPVAAGEPKNN